jgi:hypothetical protein
MAERGEALSAEQHELSAKSDRRVIVSALGLAFASFEPVSVETQPVSGRSGSQTSDIEKSPSRD